MLLSFERDGDFRWIRFTKSNLTFSMSFASFKYYWDLLSCWMQRGHDYTASYRCCHWSSNIWLIRSSHHCILHEMNTLEKGNVSTLNRAIYFSLLTLIFSWLNCFSLLFICVLILFRSSQNIFTSTKIQLKIPSPEANALL